MANEIAKLFATLGFKVDNKGLSTFQNQLKGLKTQIDSNGGISGATKRTQQQFSSMFKEIRGNYSKVRPNAIQMRKDLERIDEALKQNKISAEEYTEARLRINRKLGDLDRQRESAHQKALEELESQRAAQERAEVRRRRDAARDFNKMQKDRSAFFKAQQAAREKIKNQLTQIEKKYDKEAFKLKEIRGNVKMINDAYRRGDITLEHRRRQVQQLAAEYRRLQAAQAQSAARPFAGGRDPRQRGTHGLISALHSDAAIASMFGGFAAAGSIQSYQQIVAMEQGLTAASGSSEKAAEDMEYLIGLSRKLGVFVGDLGSSFSNFSAAARGSSLTSEEVRKTFEGVSAQARVLNLSAADTQGVMRSLTQMMN